MCYRGLHYLSEQASSRYENARSKVASFINAEKDLEVIFTKGTTEAINCMVANSYGRDNVKPGDEP